LKYASVDDAMGLSLTHKTHCSVKDLTEALIKTPKRKEWLRQPFPYKKDDSKEERRDKRDVYLYQVRPHPAQVC